MASVIGITTSGNTKTEVVKKPEKMVKKGKEEKLEEIAEKEPKPYDGSKARRFQLTLNKVKNYEDVVEYLVYDLRKGTKRKAFTFLISCREYAPTTNKEHIHIFVCYNNSMRLNVKNCGGAHIEICRGTNTQNIKYIEKDGDIIDEIGERPKGEGNRLSGKELIEMTDEEIIDFDPLHYKAHLGAKERLMNPLDISVEDWAKEIVAYYFQGPPGSWKTQSAKELIRCLLKENYIKNDKINIVKYNGSFWLGIGSADVAIYDDFRCSHMMPSEFINFIDYNRQVMNIKGGEKRNNYKVIIITSVEKLSDIYKNMHDQEPRKQWLRRIKLIDYYGDEGNLEDVNDIGLNDW